MSPKVSAWNGNPALLSDRWGWINPAAHGSSGCGSLEAVKFFHSSHACSRPDAAGLLGTLHGKASFWRFARGAKPHDRQHRKLAADIRSAWASSPITTFRLPARRGGDGVLPGVRSRSDAFQRRVHRNTGEATPAAPANTGTTSMPSRERHALKQRTADRRSNHAPHQFFSNA